MNKKICQFDKCNNPRGGRSIYCWKHQKRIYRNNNPIRAVFQNKKDDAKRRNISFELTYEEFKEFCEENNYIENKGRNSDSATIDRINSKEGYKKGNLQILSNSANVTKQRYEENGVFEYIEEDPLF